MNGNWVNKDFYAVLGVSEDAPPAEIKRAYRKLARTSHPDRNPGDTKAEERMKMISEAYDVLSDPKKRTEYDHARRMAQGRFHAGSGGVVFDASDFDFGDLFGSFFGGGMRRAPARGADLQTEALITFEDAMQGITLPIRLHEGAQVKVRVPAGVADGTRIRAKGRGGAGPDGAPPGDLYVIVRVQPHHLFGRDGANLTVDLPLTFAEAALGAQVAVPTLDGSVRLKIPAGTQPGRAFRLKGRGAPKPGGGRGDLLATARVVVPTALSGDERRILEELKATQNGSVRAHLGV